MTYPETLTCLMILGGLLNLLLITPGAVNQVHPTSDSGIPLQPSALGELSVPQLPYHASQLA